MKVGLYARVSTHEQQTLALQRDYGLGEADTVLQLPSLAFHPSVRDILGPLCAGARRVLLEEAAASDPRAILGALGRECGNGESQ